MRLGREEEGEIKNFGDHKQTGLNESINPTDGRDNIPDYPKKGFAKYKNVVQILAGLSSQH